MLKLGKGHMGGVVHYIILSTFCASLKISTIQRVFFVVGKKIKAPGYLNELWSWGQASGTPGGRWGTGSPPLWCVKHRRQIRLNPQTFRPAFGPAIEKAPMVPRAFSEPCSNVRTFKETNFKIISMETIYSDFFHGNQWEHKHTHYPTPLHHMGNAAIQSGKYKLKRDFFHWKWKEGLKLLVQTCRFSHPPLPTPPLATCPQTDKPGEKVVSFI